MVSDHGVGSARDGKPRQHLLAVGFQCVGAQVSGAQWHRRCLLHAVVAGYFRQIGIQPFPIVAGDVLRCAVRRGVRQAFVLAQRFRRKSCTVQSAAMASTFMPRSSFGSRDTPRGPRSSAGRSGHASAARPDQAGDRRAFSEPAWRCAVPHSSALWRRGRCASVVSTVRWLRTAAGVIQDFRAAKPYGPASESPPGRNSGGDPARQIRPAPLEPQFAPP